MIPSRSGASDYWETELGQRERERGGGGGGGEKEREGEMGWHPYQSSLASTLHNCYHSTEGRSLINTAA